MEADEESGSEDMDYYLETLADVIGTDVKMIWIVDSGCFTFDTFWLTTSLRGHCCHKLEVEVSKQGIHSGLGGGVIPHPFRIATLLLNRIQDQQTGQMTEPFQVNIPTDRYRECVQTAQLISTKEQLPLLPGVKTVSNDQVKDFIAQCWMPALAITGIDGIPSTENGGNVIVSKIALKIATRLPPTGNSKETSDYVIQELSRDPPYGAKVKC